MPKVERLVGVQEPQIVRRPAGVVSTASAQEAIELAAAYDHPNLKLGEAQQIGLSVGLSENADGGWAARTFGDARPRQQGKNNKITVRKLSGVLLFGEKILIHTAQALDTAKEAQRRLVEVLEDFDDLRRMVKRVRYANDERSIEFRNGARAVFKTRTKSGARGFAKVDLVIIDEAQEATSDEIAALGPTMLANPHAQMWWAGSGGLSYSTEWWRLRRRALLGPDGAFGYVEHTAEQVEVVDGKIRTTPPLDIMDRRVWAIAMPLLGGPVTVEAVESLHDQLGDEKFTREALNVWDPLPEDLEQREVKLPAEDWAATVTEHPPTRTHAGGVAVEPGQITIGFDVSKDGAWSSIGIGVGDVRNPYVELVEHREGTGWLAGRLVELIKQWKPLGVGCNGAGPTGAQVGPVIAAFDEAGIDRDLLTQMTATEYKQACGGFYLDVVEKRLLRPAGQGPLDVAAGDATERPLGDAWAWDLRSATVPISPLVAVTIARALLPIERPVPPALTQIF